MFFKGEKERLVPAAKPSMPSIIAHDVKFTGHLVSDGDIQLDGSVEGDVKSRTLIVGETGTVKGGVIAESVEVKGMVTGQIKAFSVSLAKSAKVIGDIEHETLMIEAGAWLEGHCKRVDQGAAEARTGFVGEEADTSPTKSGLADAPAV